MRVLWGVLALIVAQPVWAWGQTGHRVTGAIADRYLGPKARAGVEEILGKEGLAEAAPWPDFMRSSPDPFWQKASTPLHYVTIPDGKTYQQVGAPPQGDAITALKQFSAIATDPTAPLVERQKALRFVIHIVGDLSQPLHVGNGTDRGGNDVKVNFFGEATNLHSVWDSGLVDRQQLSYREWTDWLLAAATPGQLRDWSSPDPLSWLADSVAERQHLYPSGSELGYAYAFEQDARMRRQLTKGGLRLAAYLNAIFDAAMKPETVKPKP
ncbi:S1/P1 nuclease [Sandaracinobacteroides hominis]|uniref:S1/P1 nuclease n=1 Tax=Sandaracinobacteroides hominis TaxID=2780086 RepID=UPI0018F37C0A|nr:S1/P1 nuclease [Sandaracinobacteroides hominis]